MSQRLSALVLAVTLLTIVPGAARPAAAGTPTPVRQQAVTVESKPLPAPNLAPTQANIPCDSSPFGRVLTIGADSEIFAGYQGTFRSGQGRNLLYDRLDLSAPDTLARSFASTASDAALRNVNTQTAGTAADVDGDGTEEFVQVFSNAASQLSTITYFRNGSTLLRPYPNLTNHSELQVATVSSGPNTRDRIVVASRSGLGSVNVVMFNPVTDAFPTNYFRSNTDGRLNPSELRMAVGDMDLDGVSDDIGVAFRESIGGSTQLLVVTPEDVPETGSGANYVLDMRLVDFKRLNIGTPQRLALAQGDLNGDYRDELIYAQEQQTTDTQNVSSGIATRAYHFDPDNPALVEYLARDESLPTSRLVLATGDTDRDGRDELVRAYRDYSNNSALVVETFDAEQGQVVVRHNRYEETSGPRASFDELALDVGDMDRDGLEDIVAGVRDAGNQLNLVRLEDSELPLAGIKLAGQLRDGSGDRTYHTGLVLRLGDFDDDSLKAHYGAVEGSTLVCQRVVEPQINAAAFVPPYWQAIQATQPKSATLGDSSGQSQSTSNSITTSQSHSVSGYIGFSVGLKDIVSAGAKFTGGYKHASSLTGSRGTVSSEKLTTARSNVEGDFVLVENSEYYCYSYQVRKTGAALDGNLRFCEYKGRTVGSPSLDSWDAVNGRVNSANASHWAPVARDWANLALLLKTPAVQSSTAGEGTAGRANDGAFGGMPGGAAVTRTNSEPAPWWQVDLDTVQPISKVRVWNRDYANCGAGGCPQPLADFHVFVSSVDPRSISNDPAALKADQRVQSFYFSGVAADIATVLTLGDDLEPVRGRFVRVQLANPGVLSLSEVQVFGTNHVEPHRYPVGIADPTPGDGVFTVKMFDPHSKRIVDRQMRGNLLWNGTASGRNLLNTARIEPGGGQLRWSIVKDAGTNTAEATTIQSSYRVGVQFDLEVGALKKVKLGTGYEFESGISEQSVRTLQVTQGFEAGGMVTGFPSSVNNRRVLWPDQCSYGLQPYYYEVTEASSAGYAHRYLVLDYIVPASSLNRDANMAACQTKRTGEPTFESDHTTGGPGSRFMLTAQGFAPGAPATIDVLVPGQSQFQRVTSRTMDKDGALVFVLATASNAQPGDYQVRLTSAAAGGATTVRELTLRIIAGAEPRDGPQPGVPVIPAPSTPGTPAPPVGDPSATRRQVFVPLAAK